MIEQFVIPAEKLLFPTIGRTLDRPRINNLSDEDFAKLYLELMTEYRDKDGWWSGDKIPHCQECHQVITGPKELRRYYGRTLDAECFKKVYEAEKTKNPENFEGPVMIRYWDRVANLVLR